MAAAVAVASKSLSAASAASLRMAARRRLIEAGVITAAGRFEGRRWWTTSGPRAQLAVASQIGLDSYTRLDGADVDTGLQQMHGKGVAQAMRLMAMSPLALLGHPHEVVFSVILGMLTRLVLGHPHSLGPPPTQPTAGCGPTESRWFWTSRMEISSGSEGEVGLLPRVGVRV